MKSDAEKIRKIRWGTSRVRNSARLGLDEAAAHGVEDKARGFVDIEILHESRAMGFGSLDADAKQSQSSAIAAGTECGCVEAQTIIEDAALHPAVWCTAKRVMLERELRYLGLTDGLSHSVGVARFDPKEDIALGELMAQADHAMYDNKRSWAKAASHN